MMITGLQKVTASKVPAGKNGEKSRGRVPALNAGHRSFPLGFSGPLAPVNLSKDIDATLVDNQSIRIFRVWITDRDSP